MNALFGGIVSVVVVLVFVEGGGGLCWLRCEYFVVRECLVLYKCEDL